MRHDRVTLLWFYIEFQNCVVVWTFLKKLVTFSSIIVVFQRLSFENGWWEGYFSYRSYLVIHNYRKKYRSYRFFSHSHPFLATNKLKTGKRNREPKIGVPKMKGCLRQCLSKSKNWQKWKILLYFLNCIFEFWKTKREQSLIEFLLEKNWHYSIEVFCSLPDWKAK